MNNLYTKKYFLASRYFQRDKRRIAELAEIVESYKPKTVLDVGCGLGALVRVLNYHRGITAVGVDNAETLAQDFKMKPPTFYSMDAISLDFPDKSFDVVISTDFFEHVPEELIDSVYREMRRVGKTVLARIDLYRPITKSQARYHVTNKTREWWENKLPGVILI